MHPKSHSGVGHESGLAEPLSDDVFTISEEVLSAPDTFTEVCANMY